MNSPVDPPSRRGFLTALIAAAGAGLAAALATPLARYVLSPLGRRRGADFVPVASSSAVNTDGPVAVEVRGERVDAWTRTQASRLGLVWLRRKEDGRVLALQSECPHLGCGVRFEAAERRFACPCHESYFDLEGRALAGPSPRGMDPLDVREENGQVLVRFQRFRTQSRDREPLG